MTRGGVEDTRLKAKDTKKSEAKAAFGRFFVIRWVIRTAGGITKYNFLYKKAILMPLDHISQVFRTI